MCIFLNKSIHLSDKDREYIGLPPKLYDELGSTATSGYLCKMNHLGQRTGVSQAGTAFQAVQSVDWGYNNKGEVVKADSSINAADRSYQYDGIGNRLKSADSLTLPTSNNYTPNVLNQYTAVNSLTPGYDDDGNMTSGPLPANVSSNSTLAWDAENRLISTTVNSVTTTYLYDSQSRRIAQTTGTATTLYVYDGWNPIAEYSASTLSKTYTWGMDLSGSMQGAGGVGGLLAVTDSTGSCFPTFDGNGNISEYLDATGAIAAHYEYDPFGRETVSNGTNPNGFAHRFSTKPLDAATGLYYYGYRYYDPVTGRWPSRDPIRENGGINIYAFVGNDGVSWWDILGLKLAVTDVDSLSPNGTIGNFAFDFTPNHTKITRTGEVVVFLSAPNCYKWVTTKFEILLSPKLYMLKVGSVVKVPINGEEGKFKEADVDQNIYNIILAHEREHEKIFDKWNELIVKKFINYFYNYETNCFKTSQEAQTAFENDFNNAGEKIANIYYKAQNIEHSKHQAVIENRRIKLPDDFKKYVSGPGISLIENESAKLEFTKKPGNCAP